MADRVKIAKQELDQAISDIERLQQRVTDLQAYIRVHSSLHPSGEPQKRLRDPAAKQAVADGTFVFLQSRIGHTKTALIVDYLNEKGMKIPGKNPHGYVSQVLSRDKRFAARRKQGWILASSIVNVVRLTDGGLI